MTVTELTEANKRLDLGPSYRRIERDLRAKIESGVWRSGDLLPGRRQLATEYGVDLTTIQRGIAPLLADGMLRTDGRRGTFVSGEAHSGRKLIRSLTRQSTVRAAQDTQTSTILAMIVRCIEPGNPWVDPIMRAMERSLHQRNAASLSYNLWDYAVENTMRGAIKALRSKGANAFAFIEVVGETVDIQEMREEVGYAREPLIYVSWADIPTSPLNVYYESAYAGMQAADHLIDQGYRRLAFFQSEDAPWSQERLDAVSSGRVPAGGVDLIKRREGETLPDAASRAARELLYDDTVGVIAANDYGALAFLDAAQAIGKQAGRDYGLIGFDDAPAARPAGLTTLRPPLEAMGEEAVRLILRWVDGDHTPTQTRLHSQLISRTSTCRS